MKAYLFACAAALGLLTGVTTLAQTVTPNLNQRQRNERARIKQGVNSGELNRAEAARLHTREAQIQQEKKAAKADGVVTPDERQAVRQDQRQASRAIYRQKHDGQTRVVR